MAGFTALLVGTDSEERSSLGKVEGLDRGANTCPADLSPSPHTLLWLLWDYYHMMKICFDDVKGCIEVSKA